jgi:phage FluMu protein Com
VACAPRAPLAHCNKEPRATSEDQTIDIRCPNCGNVNSVPVREFEEHTESHLACMNWKAAVKIEAHEFRPRLEEVCKELDRGASPAAKQPCQILSGFDWIVAQVAAVWKSFRIVESAGRQFELNRGAQSFGNYARALAGLDAQRLTVCTAVVVFKRDP